MRRLTAILVTLAVALAPAAPAVAQDNTAVAVNTKDGSSVFKLAFSIKRTLQPVVDNTNAAVAFSSCENCQTVAIAIQVVLVMGDVHTVTPQNIAIAINQECEACETLASAYQWVLGTGGIVRFTKEGRRQIHEIRKALRELGRSGLPITEIQAQVDELMQELDQVLKTELEVVAPRDDDRRGDEPSEPDENAGGTQPADEPGGPAPSPEGTTEPEDASEPTTTPTPSPSPEPSETPTPAPSETPSPEPTADASATATPEPTP